MKQTIWKFEIPFEDDFSLIIPTQSEILSIQLDDKTNKPCIWALVYPENPKEERFFNMFGTGNPIYNDMGIDRRFIGTFQYQNGQFVGHVFERL